MTLKEYLEEKIPRIEEGLRQFCEKLNSKNLLDKLKTSGSISQETFRRIIYQPVKNAFCSGKRIRPILVHLTHDTIKGSFSDINKFAILVELPHKGSVIIDDIQDLAEKRDWKKPLYKSYGVATAINVGNFLYFAPIIIFDGIKLDEKKKSEILQAFFYECLIAHIGQGLDICWKESGELPTEEEYLQMNAYKTSTFRFAAKLGAISGDGTEEQKRSLVEIAEYTGIAFQLKDDLLSLNKEAHDYGSDISEGKISLMVLKTLERGGKNAKTLADILSLRTKEPMPINKAIEIMRKDGSVEYTERIAKGLAEKAKQKLTQDFPDTYYRSVFIELIDYCIQRKI